jgi:hypothetical protein
VAAATLVVSAWLVAEMVTLCAALTLLGAIYKPLRTVPTFGLSDQVTAVFEVPLIVAVNCLEWPAAKDAVFGAIVILTGVVAAGVMAGPSWIVALAVLVGSASLIATIVTSESEVTETGAE